MGNSNSRAQELFVAAAQLESPQVREEFLRLACDGDAALRAEVEQLLIEVRPACHSPGPATDDAAATAAHAAPGEMPGTLIGPYKLLEAIGEGGMGAVWVAEQTRPMRRKVALKLVKPGMDSRQVLSRFEAERQALALMDHPNIAKVYDGGMTEQGRPYFVMEYVKGIPLTQYCDDAKLPLKERLQLFVSVCQAVQHAHQKGIIHRDLKPSNILVCLYDGQPVPKVIDFGLAKAMHQPLTEHTLHTAHGFMVGTPLYMSPEQAEFNNLDVDTRTDIYSLGVILYELLTGSTPLEQQQFKQAAFDEMLRLIKEVEPPRPSTRLSGSASLPSIAAQRGLEPAQLSKQLRGDLDWIVMKTLEKERSRRYETANGLSRDIERFLHDEPVEACPPSTSYRLQKLLCKHRRTAIAAAAVVAALVLGMAGTSFGLLRARLAVAQAEQSEAAARKAAESEEKQRKIAETSAHAATKLAESEGAAKKLAEQGQAELQAVLDFVTQRIFAAARPDGVLGGLGHDVTLREAMDSAVPFVESSFRDQPLIEARLRETLGLSYLFLEDYSIASAQFEAAFRLIEKLDGLEREKATLLFSLANCRSGQRRHDEAINLADRALAISKRSLGESHQVPLQLQVLAANYYLQANRLEDARTMVQEAIDEFENTLGADAPETQRAKEKLAEVYFAQRRVDDALTVYQQVIESHGKTHGVDHPVTCEATWKWANAALNAHLFGYQFQSKISPEQALAALEAALGNVRTTWGDRNLFVVDKMQTLAYWYGQFSRYDDAVRLMEELVSIAVDWRGPDAESTLISKSRLAEAYLNADRHDDAMHLLEQVLPRMIAQLGAVDARTQVVREMWIRALREQGQLERADEASRELLAALLEADGGAVDLVSLRTRGHLFARAGKWQHAIASLEKSIDIAPDDEDSWYYVAYLYAMAGDREGYRKHCERVLARFGNTRNPTLAERVSKPCMLMPDAGLEMAPVVALTQVGVTGTEQHPYYRYFLSTRALAHYRNGEYQQAYDSAQGCIFGEGQETMNPTTGWLISSLALAKLGRRDEAVVARRNADEALAKLMAPAWNSGDLGDAWFNVVYIHILQTECDAALADAPMALPLPNKEAPKP